MKNLTEDLTEMITSMMDQIKFRNPHIIRKIHQRIRILALWSHLTRGIHNWKVDILQMLVSCGISNMRSSYQNSMNSVSRHNSKATLIWNSRTSTTTSICILMWRLYSKKTFLLVTIPSRVALSFNNTSS